MEGGNIEICNLGVARLLLVVVKEYCEIGRSHHTSVQQKILLNVMVSRLTEISGKTLGIEKRGFSGSRSLGWNNVRSEYKRGD